MVVESMCYVRGRSSPTCASLFGSAIWFAGGEFLEFTDTSKKDSYKTKQLRGITNIEALCISTPTCQLAAVAQRWGTVTVYRAPQNGQWFTHLNEFYSERPVVSLVSDPLMKTSLLVATSTSISSRELTSAFQNQEICPAQSPVSLGVYSSNVVMFAENKSVKLWDVQSNTLVMNVETPVQVTCLSKGEEGEIYVGSETGIALVDVKTQKATHWNSSVSVHSICSAEDLLLATDSTKGIVYSFTDLTQPTKYIQTFVESCVKVSRTREVAVVMG
jgi:ligand-binding sensor domain-containing protein